MKTRATILIALYLIHTSLTAAPLVTECREDVPQTAPAERFTDNQDGTVTDLWTGLQWHKCTVGQGFNDQTNRCDGDAASFTDVPSAQQFVLDLNNGDGAAGHNDWRVPNVKELASIVEYACIGPAVRQTVFEDIENASFYITNTDAGNSLYWSVYLSLGSVDRSVGTRLLMVRNSGI